MDDRLTPQLRLVGFYAEIFMLQLLRLILRVRKRIAGFSSLHLSYHMLKYLARSPHSGARELVGFGFGQMDIALRVGR